MHQDKKSLRQQPFKLNYILNSKTISCFFFVMTYPTFHLLDDGYVAEQRTFSRVANGILCRKHFPTNRNANVPESYTSTRKVFKYLRQETRHEVDILWLGMFCTELLYILELSYAIGFHQGTCEVTLYLTPFSGTYLCTCGMAREG